MISLSLPDEAAFTLFRLLRASVKTKYTPCLAWWSKPSCSPATGATVGFSSIVTKPLDISELESKIAKAMNLDTSRRYFHTEGDFLMLKLPENCTQLVVNEVMNYLKPKVSEAVDSGISKPHRPQGHQVPEYDPHQAALPIDADVPRTRAAIRVVGNDNIVAECKASRTRATGRSTRPSKMRRRA